jgi:hypothetical protein
MALIPIQSIIASPEAPTDPEALGRACCRQLEEGHILLFPETPFELPDEDRQFLLGQRQTGAGYHKNIAYRPSQDRLTGLAKSSREEAERLRAIMRSYSQRVVAFLADFLRPYAAQWRIDYASFRPMEEEGRDIRLRARNDLLHVDAFPTRPTNGDRILRIFTNLNPTAPRVWNTSETFDILASRFAGTEGLPLPKTERPRIVALLRQLGRAVKLPGARASAYDHLMHRLHNFMKENHEFQEGCTKHRWEFPPNSTWIVFTDLVSHAALSGQFALEQTFIVSRHTLVLPEKAPVAILERLCGHSLTD